MTESGENCGESLNDVRGPAQRRGTHLEMRTDEINFDWIQISQRLEGAGRKLVSPSVRAAKGPGRETLYRVGSRGLCACLLQIGKEIFLQWTIPVNVLNPVYLSVVECWRLRRKVVERATPPRLPPTVPQSDRHFISIGLPKRRC
jgi:hypothetical protein